MRIYIFKHGPEFSLDYYKLWSIGNKRDSILAVTKYCFNLFGISVIFVREGIY